MPSVSVPLNEIPGPGPGSGSDHRALLATDEPATDCSGDTSDNSPSPSTMVPSTPLAKAVADKDSEQ